MPIRTPGPPPANNESQSRVVNQMKLPFLIAVIAAAFAAAACLIETPTPQPSPTSADTTAQPESTPVPGSVLTPTPELVTVQGRSFKQYAQPPLMTIDANAAYTATIRTNNGTFTIELLREPRL